jgi:hypothetical protein
MTLASGIRYLRLIPISILIPKILRIIPQELCTDLGSTFKGDKGVAPSVQKFCAEIVLQAISGGWLSKLGRMVIRLVGEEKEGSDDYHIMHSLGLCQTQLL